MLSTFWIPTAMAQSLEPTFKKVELKEFTSLQLKVMPDAGTQLMFPFLLDNPDLRPALKIRLTNTDGFEVPTEPSEIAALLKGQNTITILGKANMSGGMPVYLGNLFISIGSYNLSIGLETTYEINKHISNVVFTLSDEEKSHLLEAMFSTKAEALEKEYREKIESIDDLSRKNSLSYIADVVLESESSTRFKKRRTTDINDYQITVNVDRYVTYGDKYGVLLFELKNRNPIDFSVDDVNLYDITTSSEKLIDGALRCSEKLLADTEIQCSYVTLDTKAGNVKKLKLDVLTNRGTGSVSW